MIDVAASGICFGEFDGSDHQCAICLIKLKCKDEAKKVAKKMAKSEDYVPSLRNLRKSNENDEPVTALDVLLERLVIVLGHPEISSFGEGAGLVELYSFYQEGVVAIIVAQDLKKNIQYLITGGEAKDIPSGVDVEDVIVEADAVVGFFKK
jgi:hypothetical protein